MATRLATMPDWKRVARAYAGDSEIHGRGLFAREPIEADEYIGCYEGIPTQENGMHVLWVESDVEGEWQGFDGTNVLRFLNHSPDPNAELDGQDLYAMQNIAAGDEITIDYGEWFEEDA